MGLEEVGELQREDGGAVRQQKKERCTVGIDKWDEGGTCDDEGEQREEIVDDRDERWAEWVKLVSGKESLGRYSSAGSKVMTSC